MKVVISDTSGRGGICHYTFFLCRALSPLVEDLTLITTKTYELDSFESTFVRENILPVHYKRRNRFFKGLVYVQSLLKILLYVFREKPDIVHFQQLKIPSLELIIYKLIKRSGIKVVLTLHTVLPFEHIMVSPFYRYIYRTIDRIIVHSKKNLFVIQKHFGSMEKEKVAVIHHGDYTSLSKPVSREEARKSLGIETEKKVMLFFGYIRRYKGLDVLLSALAILKEKHPDVLLLIAGEAIEEFERYDTIIRTQKHEQHIVKKTEYIPLEEQSLYFSAADIVVLPYRHIYQSGVVFLAYAHSRPVVGTSVGGLPEVIDDGKSGVIVPPENPEMLADKIDYLFSHQDECIMMGDYGKHLVRKKFSWDSAAKETHQLYKEIV